MLSPRSITGTASRPCGSRPWLRPPDQGLSFRTEGGGLSTVSLFKDRSGAFDHRRVYELAAEPYRSRSRLFGSSDHLLRPGDLALCREEAFVYRPDLLRVYADRKSTRLNSSHANISY